MSLPLAAPAAGVITFNSSTGASEGLPNTFRLPSAGFANQTLQQYLKGHGQLHPTGRRT